MGANHFGLGQQLFSVAGEPSEVLGDLVDADGALGVLRLDDPQPAPGVGDEEVNLTGEAGYVGGGRRPAVEAGEVGQARAGCGLGEVGLELVVLLLAMAL
ncbi:hypothetical protein F3K40_31780 [Streptomyces sp. LBUM 1478]|nr:hypothetical protein [Streptomyces sp. LBUM 1478]